MCGNVLTFGSTTALSIYRDLNKNNILGGHYQQFGQSAIAITLALVLTLTLISTLKTILLTALMLSLVCQHLQLHNNSNAKVGVEA